MKRSEALAILSRDHHRALVIAQALIRADGDTLAAAHARFCDFWAADGRRHFWLEEDLLLPAYALHGDPRHPLVLQVLGDHVAIRAQARRLASASTPGLELLHELGTALAAHVRLEERELFPIIEAAMPSAELLDLARTIEMAEIGEATGG